MAILVVHRGLLPENSVYLPENSVLFLVWEPFRQNCHFNPGLGAVSDKTVNSEIFHDFPEIIVNSEIFRDFPEIIDNL